MDRFESAVSFLMRRFLQTAFLAALLGAVVCVGTGTALAAAGELEADAPWWQHALVMLAVAAGTTILEYARRALQAGAAWLAERTKLTFWARAADVAHAVVADAFNTGVEALKAGRQDGKLTESEKAAAKDAVWKAMRDHLGAGALIRHFGPTFEADGRALIERAVTALKNDGKAARGGERLAAAVPAPDPT